MMAFIYMFNYLIQKKYDDISKGVVLFVGSFNRDGGIATPFFAC